MNVKYELIFNDYIKYFIALIYIELYDIENK